MVIRGSWKSQSVAINLRPDHLTVSIGNPVEAVVLSYDYNGRLWTAFFEGVSYRRGLDGRILAKWRVPGGDRQRRWLPTDEACQVEAHACDTLAQFFAATQSGTVKLNTPLPDEVYLVLSRATAFDAERSHADAVRYHEIYRPVGILPPDQYLALVLQATEGCSFNTCTFCDFYKGRPFRIKSPNEFRVHAEAVREFLGAGLRLRRSIFLGDANALVIPMPKLLPLFEVVHAVFDVPALGGIYAFLDGFSGEKKSGDDYRQLAELSLKRIYVGLESGSAALLKFLRKPGEPDDVVNAVRLMKHGGVAVGVIVLLGAGGHQYAAGHVQDTITAINRMKLDRDDILYLSELVTSEGLAYARTAQQDGLTALTHEERLAQGEAIIRGLVSTGRDAKPRVSRYDIREFIY